MEDQSSPKFQAAPILGGKEVDRFAQRVYLKDGWQGLDRITLDLTRLTTVHYPSAARLLSIIEGLARTNTETLVRLAAPRMTRSELDFMAGPRFAAMPTEQHMIIARNLRNRIRSRTRALGYLQRIGFQDAILDVSRLHGRTLVEVPEMVEPSAAQNAMPRLLYDELYNTGRSAKIDEASGGSSPAVVPFRWLAPSDSVRIPRTDHTPRNNDNLDQPLSPLQLELVNFVYGRGITMTRGDAVALINNVLGEILENVHEHANLNSEGPKSSLLFGAIREVPEARFATLADGNYELDKESVERYASRGQDTGLQLVLCDSGVGLVSTLRHDYLRHLGSNAIGNRTGNRNSDVVIYSLKSTASRLPPDRPRGIGLAAVDRHTRSYDGRLQIRTANVLAGVWYPDGQRTQLEESGRLPYVPGTSVQLTLGGPVKRRPRLLSRETSDFHIEILTFAPGRANEEHRVATLIKKMRPELAEGVGILVTEWPQDRELAKELALSLGRLASILESSAPMAAILAGAVVADVESTFPPLDDIREESSTRSTAWSVNAWTPPFRILTSDGIATWSGGSERLRGVLYQLDEGGVHILEDALSSMALRSAEQDYVATNRDWLEISDDQQLRVRVQADDFEIVATQAIGTAYSLAYRSRIPNSTGSTDVASGPDARP